MAKAQKYNIVAMGIFCGSRFICTFLLKFFSPGGLLMSLAIAGGALILGTIFVTGMPGLYCLIGVSACMSLMFPTIYGIALKGLGEDAKTRCCRTYHGYRRRLCYASSAGLDHGPERYQPGLYDSIQHKGLFRTALYLLYSY